MGRDWLGKLNVNIGQVNLLENDKIKEVLDKHKAVFDGSIGCLKDAKVTLQVNKAAKPKFLKPRTVPYLLREKVEKQLSKMEQQSIISPVQHSQWAAPLSLFQRVMVPLGSAGISRPPSIKPLPLRPTHSHEWMTFLLIFLEASFSPSWTCPMPTYSCHCPTSPNSMSLSTPTKGSFNLIVSRSSCHQPQQHFKELWRHY